MATPKPKIEYVGDYYVYGSEVARKDLTRPRKKSPLPKVRKNEKIRYDISPMALCGMVLAVFFVGVLIFGAVQLQMDWKAYQTASATLTQIKRENALLEHNYRKDLDLAQIEATARANGMVPVSEVEVRTIHVTVPEPRQERTWLDDFRWFMSGLLAE